MFNNTNLFPNGYDIMEYAVQMIELGMLIGVIAVGIFSIVMIPYIIISCAIKIGDWIRWR